MKKIMFKISAAIALICTITLVGFQKVQTNQLEELAETVHKGFYFENSFYNWNETKNVALMGKLKLENPKMVQNVTKENGEFVSHLYKNMRDYIKYMEATQSLSTKIICKMKNEEDLKDLFASGKLDEASYIREMNNIMGVNELETPAVGPEFGLYWDKNYNGKRFALSTQSSLVNWNKQASSVQIPSDRVVVLFSNTNWTGVPCTLNQSSPDLGKLGFNDKACSMRYY
jgi:hypothetical protein